MAQITAPHTLGVTSPTPAATHRPVSRPHDADVDTTRRERLRSILPVALSVGLLLAVVVTSGYLLRDLLDFGVWFLSQP